jgi:hypothetical protein
LLKLDPGENAWQFFMEQRKGPVQFVVSYIPYLFTHNFMNEFAERLPFTIFGYLSIFVFYIFVRKLSESPPTAFIATFLFLVNGFITGFARIAQYQNINLFFSFLALYFYSDFLKPTRRVLRNTLLGTLMFSLSLLSHWDAIFVLFPVIYFVVVFLKNPEISNEEKRMVLLYNIALGALVLLPILIPYTVFQVRDPSNSQYFFRRVSLGIFEPEGYVKLIRLYNPFLFLEFLVGASLIGIFGKKSWLYLSWGTLNYLIFQLFVRKPGTHIYNFIIPFSILAATGFALLMKKLPLVLRPVVAGIYMVFMAFFVYQTYIIFIDHRVEYPWNREQLMDFTCKDKSPKSILIRDVTCEQFLSYFKTPIYKAEETLPLFGFPLNRHWNEINAFINNENSTKNESFGYVSNELKTITEKYMDAKYRVNKGFYAVAIRKPLSFEDDWSFDRYSKKSLVKEYFNDGWVVVRIYRVEPGMEK